MREALAARSGRDFVTAGAGRHADRRRAGALQAFAGLLLRRPNVVAAGVILTAVFTAVAVNALFWQKARHPAPLFEGKRTAEKRSAPPAPVPPPRPAAESEAPSVSRTAAVAPAVPAPTPPPKPASRDLIGDLIRGHEPPSPAGRAEIADARVAAAQRALVKLNYGPLKVDGLIGPETRSAIERFERDRRLPITGELNGRTLRELGLQGSPPIE